jgi:predicted transcriptional regulator
MARNMDRKISSVSRILEDLQAKALILKKYGKPSMYNITDMGRLMLTRQSKQKLQCLDIKIHKASHMERNINV